MKSLQIPLDERKNLWNQLFDTIDRYYLECEKKPVKQAGDLLVIRRELAELDFNHPVPASEALAFVSERLARYQTHFANPHYFGLFDPRTNEMGVAADALVATFNPQLASSIQSAFPIEVEELLVRQLGEKVGFAKGQFEGSFTSGGTEANSTATMCALSHHFPDWKNKGVRAFDGQPTLYLSSQTHHSNYRAARITGLGDEAVREIPVDGLWRIDLNLLRAQIKRDREQGLKPFLLVGTVGTTSAGIIDPLPELAELAREEKLWFHVDAAWGGGLALAPKYRPLMRGIELADSVTLDAHKWLSVPMGAGIFLTRHLGLSEKTFAIETGYIPAGATLEPYKRTLQWSRRFIGLKLLLSLQVFGWEGYAAVIEKQIELGQKLRSRLKENHWRLENDTGLPVVCFTNEKGLNDEKSLSRIADFVVRSGKSWVSVAKIKLPNEVRTVLRAAVVNHASEAKHLEALLAVLNDARFEVTDETSEPT